MNFPSLSRWMRRFLPLPTIIALAVVAFITFYGDNSVVRRIEYDRQIDSLRHELKANRDTMLYYRELNARLSSDPDMVESVVRQEYNMARPDEDVYIFK
ncbi:MAG: septum formation initiator family protein [Muribaculaceae bacterium]